MEESWEGEKAESGGRSADWSREEEKFSLCKSLLCEIGRMVLVLRALFYVIYSLTLWRSCLHMKQDVTWEIGS